MPKQVKIVLMQDVSDDYYSQKIIRDSISDWEEVSDDDFRFLQDNLFRIFRDIGQHGYAPTLLVKDDQPITARIKQIRDAIEKQRRVEQEEKEKKANAQAEAAKKRLLKKANSERELLAQLQAKYPDMAPELYPARTSKKGQK